MNVISRQRRLSFPFWLLDQVRVFHQILGNKFMGFNLFDHSFFEYGVIYRVRSIYCDSLAKTPRLSKARTRF